MKKLIIVTCITSALLHLQTAHAIEQDTQTILEENKKTDTGKITITGKRIKRISKGATGLSLDIKNTPQSISVISQEHMQKFGNGNLNDTLRLGTGVNVEEWETNRTNYMARGFDIVNTQTDGTGMPNDWGLVTGAMDSYGYSKIEIIRGANGLLTGVGNSSGTINYIRKRPINTTQGEVNVSVGSYQFKRLEADYSQSLTENGSWAMRIATAIESKGSHVRDLQNKRSFFYGVIDGQIGDDGVLTLGYSNQHTKTNGNMWGGLVFGYSDGTYAQWDISASTAQNWSKWDTINQTAFVEYAHKFNDNWNGKLSYNHRQSSEESKLFYVYTIAGLDKSTKLGLKGWPGNWPFDGNAHLLEANLIGDFSVLGREHQIILGVNYSQDQRTQYQRSVDVSSPAWGDLPAFPYDGNQIAEPIWSKKTLYSDIKNQRSRFYAASKLSLNDKLNAVVGVNAIMLTRKGLQTDEYVHQTEEKISPYAGLTYEVTDQVSAYTSYSDIYQNQDYTDINEKFLPAMKGLNLEAGVKAEWFNKQLLSTFAIFKAKQNGLGTYVGLTSNGTSYYEPKNVESKGIEIELTGHINEHVNAVLSYTKLALNGSNGKSIYEWVPRQNIGLLLSGKIPSSPQLSWGMSGQWRSETSRKDAGFSPSGLVQPSYAILNAYTDYQLSKNINLRFNLNNIGNQKYITSLYNVGYYGAPRNASLTLNYKL